jgi:hypothetical protein
MSTHVHFGSKGRADFVVELEEKHCSCALSRGTVALLMKNP